jgi:hypothetical protein
MMPCLVKMSDYGSFEYACCKLGGIRNNAYIKDQQRRSTRPCR